MKSIGIGGQAVVEGVMIKKGSAYTIAMNKKDSDEIEVTYDRFRGIMGIGFFSKIPILRGIFALIDQIALESRTLTYSADFYEENLSKNKKKNENTQDIVLGIIVILALITSILVFVVGPLKVALYVGGKYAASRKKQILVEAAMRVVLFIIYGVLMSFIKDIRRMCKYKGAQNKVISCIENNEQLTIENVRKYSKISNNNLSAFLLTSMFLSIVVFSVVRNDDMTIKMVCRFASIFLVTSIYYEIVNFFNDKRNIIGKIVGIPDTLVQMLITKNPTDEMIKTAILAANSLMEKNTENTQQEEYGMNYIPKQRYDNETEFPSNETEFADNETTILNNENAFPNNETGFSDNETELLQNKQDLYNTDYNDVKTYQKTFAYDEMSNYETADNRYSLSDYNNNYDDATDYSRELGYEKENDYEEELKYENNTMQGYNQNQGNYALPQYENQLPTYLEETHVQTRFGYERENINAKNYNNNSLGNYADLDVDGYGEFENFNTSNGYTGADNEMNNNYYTKSLYGENIEEENDDVLNALDRMFDDNDDYR